MPHSNQETKIVRTVYLTPAMNEKLRVKGFRDHISKSDIIQEALLSYFGKSTSDYTIIPASKKSEEAYKVLTTVYLTEEIDTQLRLRAYEDARPKDDVIRDAISIYFGEPVEDFRITTLIGEKVKLEGTYDYELIINSVNLTPYHPGVSDDYRFVLYPEGNSEIRIKARFEDLQLTELQKRFYEDHSKVVTVEKNFMK